jgi:hypothetical protein
MRIGDLAAIHKSRHSDSSNLLLDPQIVWYVPLLYIVFDDLTQAIQVFLSTTPEVRSSVDPRLDQERLRRLALEELCWKTRLSLAR